MNRLTLVATIGAVLVAAILGLLYAVSKQDVDEPAAQSQPANPPAASGTQPSPATATPSQNPATAVNQTAPTSPATTDTQPSTAPTAQPSQASTNPQTASAANSAAQAKPSFDVVRVNPNGDAVVAGRASPGAKITLLDEGHAIGSATADDRGEWVLLPDSAIDPGQHKFSLKATDDKGGTLESEKEVIVVVPKPAEDIAGQPVTRPSGALAIEVPKQGEAPTQLLNAPSSAASAQPATASSAQPAATPAPPLSLDTIDYTQDGRAMLSGHTLPGSDLIIYLDNISLGAAKADGNGRWTFVPEQKAPIGDHELRVDMVDGGGKVQARVKVPFSQPDFSIVSLKDDSVIVQPGNSLWRIARRTYGNGVLYTVIYEANKDRIDNPDLIYPGQIFQVPKKKD
ncbi:MAG TPA: LysM peptidoglycan-binding domain-containing protein [Candidatus Binatia bacterium]|nr:LysM peptidoglycan-binding domain-containing protein [Candidatus Binatia bacterium]